MSDAYNSPVYRQEKMQEKIMKDSLGIEEPPYSTLVDRTWTEPVQVSSFAINKDLLQDQVDTLFDVARQFSNENSAKLLLGAGNLLYMIWQQLEDDREVKIVTTGKREPDSGVYRGCDEQEERRGRL